VLALNDHGRADFGPDAEPPEQRRELARRAFVGVEPAWCGRASDNGVDRVTVEAESRAAGTWAACRLQPAIVKLKRCGVKRARLTPVAPSSRPVPSHTP
jgi:hypothetical protein